VEPFLTELALAAGNVPEEVDVSEVRVYFGKEGGKVCLDVGGVWLAVVL